MTREPFRPVDAAWLRMDSADNAMVITAMLLFDALPERDRLLRLIEERLLPHRRFRQRVVDSRLAGPAWEIDPCFDVAAHFHRIALPSPGGQAELETLVGELMSIPLDHTRPLWQIYAIEGVGNAAALVARLHHSMGDGVALVRLLLGLTDEGPLAPPPEVGVDAPHPTRVVDRAKLLARQTATLGRLLVLPGDHETVFRGELGTRKLAAWSPAIELDIPKAIAKATGTKLNDVLVSALTGALRRELEARASFDRKHEIRALVPVYVRNEAEASELGNHFGLVYVPLPLNALDPIERLAEVKTRFDEVKAEPDAVVSLGVLAAMGVATSELERIGIELFTKKASVMITNVPGPPLPIHFGDRVVTDMLVWAPVSGQVGVALSLLSYANQVRLGVAVDALRVPEPANLARMFTDEIETLFRATRKASRFESVTSSVH